MSSHPETDSPAGPDDHGAPQSADIDAKRPWHAPTVTSFAVATATRGISFGFDDGVNNLSGSP